MFDLDREAIGYAVPVVWILGLLALAGELSPVARLLGASAGLLLAIKVGCWFVLRARGREWDLTPIQTALFWIAWPGVRPDEFAGESDSSGAPEHAEPDPATFVAGYVAAGVGVLLVLSSMLAAGPVGALRSSWLLLFGLLAVGHVGVGRMYPFALRWLGHPVPPLFEAPLRSRSVAAFWSERWNRPFVGMNRLLVTGPLSGRVGIGAAAAVAFAVSGALHELAISFPAGGGWGLPVLYFGIQAAAYSAEHAAFPDPESRPALGRAWTYLVVFAPLPLLFHVPFRATFLVPVVEWGRGLLLARPLADYVAAGLWIGAAGHLLVLVASVQVPDRLGWREDLQSLRPFNRKLLWTYGGFIVLTILAFGVMTAAYHGELLAGAPLAIGFCGFVAAFWTARLVVDAAYFSHDDWPEGVEFVVGHALLNSLFVLLVAIYAGTIAFHLS